MTTDPDYPANPSQQTRWAEDRGQPDYPGQDRDVLAEALCLNCGSPRSHVRHGPSRGDHLFLAPDPGFGPVVRANRRRARDTAELERLTPAPGAAPEVEGLRARLDDQLLGTEDWPDKTEDTVPVGLLRDLRAALRDTAPALDVERLSNALDAAFLSWSTDPRNQTGITLTYDRDFLTTDGKSFASRLAAAYLEGASRDT